MESNNRNTVSDINMDSINSLLDDDNKEMVDQSI